MWTLLQDDLKELFIHDKNVAPLLPQVEQSVIEGKTTPSAASRRLLERFRRH
jgi:LAO/AO transport system kinase